ncbi:MAG: putative secondary metabolism biosynthetic enzyme [Chrysothrix sp. TS-e1954]|nr:MAG: putative secondary metabolism biosynthetic enzyme [Chrysothrix sp. TS-e1954]
MRYWQIDDLETLLNADFTPRFRWEQAWEDIADTPFLILHTSGSSGLPKPIHVTHRLISTIDCQQLLSDVSGRQVTARAWAEQTVFTCLPPFHSAAINLFAYSIFQGSRLILGPADQPPSLKLIETVLHSEMASCGVMPPSLLAEAAAEQSVLEALSSWSSVAFGGGPLSHSAGDAIWEQGTKVIQLLGSTETFNLPELMPLTKDEWPYHRFHPNLGLSMRHHSGLLCELTFTRDSEFARHQGAFHTFPDLQEYSMGDLYEAHPAENGLWMYKGRIDNILVLSNGEKFNPCDAERLIATQPGIKSALIVGAGREQTALLVEPKPDHLPSLLAGFQVEQAVQSANNVLPAHAQIHQSHVRVLNSPNKFLRSSKGEIQRRPTIEALDKLITDIYQTADTNSTPVTTLEFSSPGALERTLLKEIFRECHLKGSELLANNNIFDYGFDSLKTIRLARCINQNLQNQNFVLHPGFQPRHIYEAPTPALLADKLLQLIDGKNAFEEQGSEEMERMLDTYTSRLLHRTPIETSEAGQPAKVVLLTGSSGSLGSYILDSLLQDSKIDSIICINRSGTTVDRQVSINRKRGLSTHLARVAFEEADMTMPFFGLEAERFMEMAQAVTHIIHNAWPVNFNLTLASFELQLQACCKLIEFAQLTSNQAGITFISSVGAAKNWGKTHIGLVPETQLIDLGVAESMGYAQSKLLAELLLAEAAERFRLRVTICRAGQIAGPVTSSRGMWNVDEWFPSMYLTCKTVGKAPTNLGTMNSIDWIPVDLLANIITELTLHRRDDVADIQESRQPDTIKSSGCDLSKRAFNSQLSIGGPSPPPNSNLGSTSPRESTAEFLNLVNPQTVEWEDLVDSILPSLGSKGHLVSYHEWLAAVKAISCEANVANTAGEKAAHNLSEVPVKKLLGFFEKIGASHSTRTGFSTIDAQTRSRTLATLPPVSSHWIEHWIRQWQDNCRAVG